ncbi:acyl-CoA reductase-like NAD-dependent aldehyde dehydrogenase [Krasilnikovia cinnamomea]|uniref:Acyl-CoA reductase-like NAD-dependent aldehyde dehydrogenase n=1 Tax=Krasilnikovia cinnamomea TaxID=349313 RepID=A0A4V2G7I3_9ACTN|nr:acyl-CoA reductase-like NAD-dependent aldehyde dehydrogenase [Krasilnikovia cinnamomea]
MTLRLAPGTAWADALSRATAATPEAFTGDRLRNHLVGAWEDAGQPAPLHSPIDGTRLGARSRLDARTAALAVRDAAEQHRQWAATWLPERRARVQAALEELSAHRDLLALLQVWEIGAPWSQACADVDRALDAAGRSVDQAEHQLKDRDPLPGPVSHLPSWQHPMSVLVQAELAQLLTGNAVIARIPSQGGAVGLTVAHAIMARAGLPVTLLSGCGTELSPVLVRSREIGAVSRPGEQDSGNAWGIWEFSQWDRLVGHLRTGFAYGKQHGAAYRRFVVQRELVDRFLDAYLPVLKTVHFGHPLAVATDGDPLPELDYGPLISADTATELRREVDEAISGGAVPLHRGSPDAGRFLDGQDTSAYVAPTALLVRSGRTERPAGPFGPVDTIVVADTEDELLSELNAPAGTPAASLAVDDEELAGKLARDERASQVTITHFPGNP